MAQLRYQWEIIKYQIPFSKFFFTSKGRIQDIQYPVPLFNIASFGITLGERTPGPFHLEIDYIGLEFDPSHTEKFAYELYRLPSSIAAT
ncbi:Complex I intermediate-associated protein 30, mitochondrial [Homalodisca vitripennis]|nr:Complex I intermediate-associated protein 30, mitochondrial [Homalodisca vitripennis]